MVMKKNRIVVLGVGNILLTDEGVGVRVVEELDRRYAFPDNVSLVDGGTQGLALMATIQEADHLVVVDAVMGGGTPGTIYRLEKEDLPKGLRMKQSAHDSDLIEALNLSALIDQSPQSVVVIGIEPESLTPFNLELSEPVKGKVEELIKLVLDELSTLGIEPEKKSLEPRAELW